jgi:hypothetical protein
MTSYRAENYTPEIKRQKMVGRELTSEEAAKIKEKLSNRSVIRLDKPETWTEEQKKFMDWLAKQDDRDL